MADQQKTPLYECHVARAARFIDFGEWVMPLQYTSIIEEHETTRRCAGLFDVCHMGELEVTGHDALEFLQFVLTRDLRSLTPGRMKLSLILNEKGGIKDDVTVYAFEGGRYRIVTNAITRDKVFQWLLQIKETKGFHRVEIRDESAVTGKIDLQGPQAEEILAHLCDAPLSTLKYYRFIETAVAHMPALVSRSGYTGEDGFEIYMEAPNTPTIWEAIMEAGKEKGLMPVGLGARDTLRMEAGLMLYGADMDETVHPYEVVYGWAVDLNKEFMGREALIEIIGTVPRRRLVGFVMEGKGIARHGQRVFSQGRDVGWVTSGTYAPTLGRAIGMAFVPPELALAGSPIAIDIRGHLVEARTVNLPFYRRVDRTQGSAHGERKP